MKKATILYCLIVLFSLSSFATHQRAAEITYRYISGLTYEFTILTYTYTPSPADRPSLTLSWGDGTSSDIQRIQKINLPNNITKNVYVGNHTFSAPSTYIISMLDPNRNYGVINVPNSVNIPMYVETMLTISPFLGPDNSPVLLNPPIDNGCVFVPFIHNPGAYDPDGDSLSFRLVNCKGTGGQDIPGYTYPQTSSVFKMDSITGDLLWDSPMLQGEYNVAFLIEEWRKGVRIGYVTRDMQITIGACNDHPPVITCIQDTCIDADSTLSFPVTATDIDMNFVTMTASGGPLNISNSPATFPQPVSGTGSVTSTFTWHTNCSHVRKNKYLVYFKAIDNSSPIALVAYKTLQIKVNGPAPKNLTANAAGNGIFLNWYQSGCSNAVGYKIYRRLGFYGYVHSFCETGVPAYTGYSYIGQTNSLSDTTYYDNDNGNGLIHGNDYCYMVIAYYPDDDESYASNEACAKLKKDVPVITNVSVTSTDINTGSIYIAWSKPTEFDTLLFPGPYRYLIWRSQGNTFSSPALIDSLEGINDTIYHDTLLNTQTYPYSYRIDFYNVTPSNYFFVGSTHTASSVFLSITPSDKKLLLQWHENVPWTNDTFAVFKKNPSTLLFDSIGFTVQHQYIDTGLANGANYCYLIKSIGQYSSTDIIHPLINFSQIACGIPIDNTPPCPPVLSLSTDCISNYLNWTQPDPICAYDVAAYNVYYLPDENSSMTLISHINNAHDTSFTHNNIVDVLGCYVITSIDSAGNESLFSNFECVTSDSCSGYELPNIFTPNGDGINDLFMPKIPYYLVEKVDMKIFNRWGKMLYQTSNPDINWDGKDMTNHADCAEGVYYYVCDVYEYKIKGIKKRTLSGSVSLYR
ncbi:MAG: gliding motility-associated C-terminal domain-containing protein [Bacteroidota bacterium]